MSFQTLLNVSKEQTSLISKFERKEDAFVKNIKYTLSTKFVNIDRISSKFLSLLISQKNGQVES